jgi:hypothetical protein
MPNWFLTDCDIIEPGIGVSHRRAASVDVQPNVICSAVSALLKERSGIAANYGCTRFAHDNNRERSRLPTR